MAEDDAQITLYKYGGAVWGMPSICPGCLTAEAYARFAGVRCAIKELSVPARSPTGWLPALEDGDVIVGIDSEVESRDEQVSAAEIIAHLQRGGFDLDVRLDSVGRAEAAAFRSLIDAKLAPAVLFCTWLEQDSFKAYTKPAYSADTPGPVSWWQLMMRRRAVAAQVASRGLSGPLAGDKIFQAADEACAALAAQLGSKLYFGGDAPSSLDAAAFPMLCFALRAPVAEGPLRDSAERHAQLRTYVNRVQNDWFEGGSAEGSAGTSASTAAGNGPARPARARTARKPPPPKKQPPTEKELRFKQRTRLAIAFAVVTVVAYVVLGEMVDVSFGLEDDEDDDAEE